MYEMNLTYPLMRFYEPTDTAHFQFRRSSLRELVRVYMTSLENGEMIRTFFLTLFAAIFRLHWSYEVQLGMRSYLLIVNMKSRETKSQ